MFMGNIKQNVKKYCNQVDLFALNIYIMMKMQHNNNRILDRKCFGFTGIGYCTKLLQLLS